MGGFQSKDFPCLTNSSKKQPQKTLRSKAQSGQKLCHLSIQIQQNGVAPRPVQIGPLGYNLSQRLSQDGLTFFGYSQKDHEKKLDVRISAAEQIKSKFRGPQFCIVYIWALNQYLLKDLENGAGTFQMVQDWIAVRDGLLIQCGSKFLLFTPGSSGLSIIQFGKSKQRKTFVFAANQKVFIGRKILCQISIQEKEVSKIQASVYCVGGEWILKDGNLVTGKKSTNGTWIYLDSPTVLQTGMVLKVHDVYFRVSLSFK